MNKEELRALLESVSQGELSVDKALTKLKLQPYEDLGFAKIDTHRGIRQGAEEVIFAQGKTEQQLEKITVHMLENSKSVLITRLDAQKARALSEKVSLFYDTLSRIGIAGERPHSADIGNIVIATGGTSDIPVAEEAALASNVMNRSIVPRWSLEARRWRTSSSLSLGISAVLMPISAFFPFRERISTRSFPPGKAASARPYPVIDCIMCYR